MSTLSKLMEKFHEPNAFFKMVLKGTDEIYAYHQCYIETDEDLDLLIFKNSRKFNYIQITKDEYDKIVRPIYFKQKQKKKLK